MEFYVKFWGTRGSIPTPGYRTKKFGGNTSCVEIRIGQELIICDAGSGLREMGLDLVTRKQQPPQGHFFFSHAHWDHIQGFPFFLPAYQSSYTFFVYGTSAEGVRVYDLLSGQMQSSYHPVDFSELSANIQARELSEGKTQIDGIEVDSYAMNHPGGATTYSFAIDGRKTIYASDCEVDAVLANREESLADPQAPRRLPTTMVDFFRDADLAIIDGQYTDQEYLDRIGWGHSRATTLVDLAVAAGVKQLAVTHHDPMQADDDVSRKIAACRSRAERLGSDLIVFGAREGMELKID